jgi:UDP-N-acetylmuramate dehydrogenase
LVRDGGVPGVVIRLGRGFVDIKAEGETVTAGAGALDLNVALVARDAAIAGLEFLSGIPGTIGGALRMNGGAYNVEMKDVVVIASALDARGNRHQLDLAALRFTYRHCAVAEDWIFTSTVLHGRPGDRAAIQRRMDEINAAREESQPVRTRTGGSTFANPAGHKAWELIDKVGGRGLKVGGAMVSEKHCNFLINTGEATADHIERLGEELRRRVREQFGIALEWEIRRLGVPRSGAGGDVA